MTKQTAIISIIWIMLAAVIYYLIDDIQNPNKIRTLGTESEVILKRGLDGHYRAEALINGEKVNVLVDTGATGVAISQSLADQLGLKSVNAIGVNTANGDSVGYMVRLRSVKIGGIEESNVSAMIAPNLEGDVLLGMSFLGRLDLRLFKGEMTLKQVTD